MIEMEIKEVNGCGPEWLPDKVKDMLFNWFHEASCNKHDIGYTQGGNEVRRFECDWNFLQAMKRDSTRYFGLNRYLRLSQAYVFFMLVRLGGWKSFNYMD